MIILFGFIMIIVFAVCIELIREQKNFTVTEYMIRDRKLDLYDKKTVVFLSDLHNHVYGKENDELLESIRKIAPDYIFIGGDMLVGKDGCGFEPALNFVKQLPQIAPVYYGNGNHEQRMKEEPEEYSVSFVKYQQELLKAGVHFLENESAVFNWNNTKVRLTGLEIPRRCYKHFKKEALYQEEIVERIGKSKTEFYEILLAHNPSYMDKYLEWGADLTLSGHLHGGLVRIPGVAGAISPSFEIFPKYSGDHYQNGEQQIVVSKGLGMHTFKIRLLNPAEVVVLSFRGDASCEKVENPV